jgi:hypothetical protein
MEIPVEMVQLTGGKMLKLIYKEKKSRKWLQTEKPSEYQLHDYES